MTERFRKDTLMSMMNTGDILETIEMFTQDNLDVRTVTMGISLLDCIDPDPKKACEKIYNKITTKAADLVPAVEHISAEYGAQADFFICQSVRNLPCGQQLVRVLAQIGKQNLSLPRAVALQVTAPPICISFANIIIQESQYASCSQIASFQ